MVDERTEPATPRRRKKAREEGQVARSGELVGTVLLLGVLCVLPTLAPRLGLALTQLLKEAVAAVTRSHEAGLISLLGENLRRAGLAAGPLLLLVVLAAVGGNVAQVGWHWSARVLQPQWARLNPGQGFRRLFAARSAVELAKGSAKAACVALSAWYYLSSRWDQVASLPGTDPLLLPSRVGGLAHGMAFRMVATLAVLAALDCAYQRWQFERSLRMTKAEVKEELRELEGRPEVRAHIRARQRSFARRRMMAAVPLASVVIVNPTHVAVALKYEPGREGAPRVVAKGRDRIARRIREVAEGSGVPVVENPPLARSLHQMAELDQEIPPALFRAVAEVLALVWRRAEAASPGTGRQSA